MNRYTPTEEAQFKRVADHVIDAPLGKRTTIAAAACREGMAPGLAQQMWDEKIEATHGGDPR